MPRQQTIPVGKILHAAGQLSPCAPTAEPVLPQSPSSQRRAAPTTREATRGNLQRQQQRHGAAKNTCVNLKKRRQHWKWRPRILRGGMKTSEGPEEDLKRTQERCLEIKGEKDSCHGWSSTVALEAKLRKSSQAGGQYAAPAHGGWQPSSTRTRERLQGPVPTVFSLFTALWLLRPH